MTIDKKELKVLRQAILNELEGYNFYMLAAEKAANLASKEVYLHLASEEEKHISWLKEMYNSISNNSEISVPSDLEESTSPQIFNWDNAGTESGSLAVSVFGIAIQMEKASIDFYKKAAQETNIDAAKKLYTILIRWEEDHLATFEKHYDNLKDEWWQKQGFNPS